MDFRYEIKNLDQVQLVFKELEEETKGKIIIAAARKACRIIADEVARMAPVFRGAGKVITQHRSKRSGAVKRLLVPGLLQKSIYVKLCEKAATGVKMWVTNRGIAFYGLFQEFGTRFIQGLHFFSKAVDAKGNEAIETFNEEVRRITEQTVNRLARKHNSNRK